MKAYPNTSEKLIYPKNEEHKELRENLLQIYF